MIRITRWGKERTFGSQIGDNVAMSGSPRYKSPNPKSKIWVGQTEFSKQQHCQRAVNSTVYTCADDLFLTEQEPSRVHLHDIAIVMCQLFASIDTGPLLDGPILPLPEGIARKRPRRLPTKSLMVVESLVYASGCHQRYPLVLQTLHIASLALGVLGGYGDAVTLA